MNTAKTLKGRTAILLSWVLVAGVAALISFGISRKQAERTVEAVNVACGVKNVAQLMAISDMLQQQDIAAVERRIVMMAKQEMAFYDRSKANTQIPPETHQAAADLHRRIATRID